VIKARGICVSKWMRVHAVHVACEYGVWRCATKLVRGTAAPWAKLRRAAAGIGLRQFALGADAAGFMMKVSDGANPASAGFVSDSSH
jgi:hypothetical protein